MQKIKKYKSIFLINADPIKNAGYFKEYFIENSQDFVSFHFFPSYTKKVCYMEKYSDGKILLKKEFDSYKGNNVILKNIFNYASFLYICIFEVKKGSYFITNAPIYCIGSSILKIIKSFNYILWLGDYYPNSKFPMNIYNFIVYRFNNKFKNVIYLSPPLKSVYYDKKKCKSDGRVIPLGIKKIFIKNTRIKESKMKIGFIGVIRKQQGLDLFFSYLSKNNDCDLEIIGEGYHLSYYKDLAKKYNIQNKIKFFGSVEDMSKVANKWDVGIALYENTQDNLSRYCEPTKIKDYLSFGIPVVTTRTTYFHNEIEKYNAGIVVSEDIDSLKQAITKIKKSYSKYLSGVNILVDKYEYYSWYNEKFKFIT